MKPVSCRECGTSVLVEKYSPQHTGIQWPTDADGACPRITESNAAAIDGASAAITTRRCAALLAAINTAVESGEIPLTRRTEPSLR